MKKIVGILLSITLVFSATGLVFASEDIKISNENDVYSIQSVEMLKEILSNTESNGEISLDEQSEIIKNTSPKVISDFITEKTQLATTAVNNLDVDSILKDASNGRSYGKESVDLGDGAKVIVEFEDGRDNGNSKNILNQPTNALRASDGETMWKDYGNRYFTVTTKLVTGVGFATGYLEHHYILSEKGIDVNFGDAYVDFGFSVGILGSASAGLPVITDSSARTPGASDVNIYARFSWQYSGAGILGVQDSKKVSSTVGFVDINKTNKQIKVKHSWSIS